MDALQDVKVTSSHHRHQHHGGTIEDPEELKEYNQHKINNINLNMDNLHIEDKIIILIDLEIATTKNQQEKHLRLLIITVVIIEIIAARTMLHRIIHLGNNIRTLVMIQLFHLMARILLAIQLLQQLQHRQHLQHQYQQLQIICIHHSITNTCNSIVVLHKHMDIKLILMPAISLLSVERLLACSNQRNSLCSLKYRIKIKYLENMSLF